MLTLKRPGVHNFLCAIAQFSVHTVWLVSEKAGEKYDLLDLTLEKYNIYILIDVVIGIDTGKKSGVRFYPFDSSAFIK